MEPSHAHSDPRFSLTNAAARKLLERYKIVAVVGLSTNPGKPGHFVPKYLQENGYTIIPVNPMAKEDILGEKVYASLKEIPGPVEIVEIFRHS
ncbi:MAG TPA: CoA-binding protein, partial [Nitrospiria bacterium]|nr:CoA-binding protein [Nitrospiria bacterium]